MLTCVRLIPERFIFVSDSQDTEAIKNQFPSGHLIHEYDSFFVCPDTGAPVYAISGVVPYLSKIAVKVATMEDCQVVKGA